MSGVVRLALAYFSVVPLQRWISILGAGLMLLSIVMAAFGADAGAGTVMLAVLGAGMIAMIPMMIGGGMHRHVSSRTLMHMRPNGRLRMLLAATLVVTFLAAVAALPVLVSHSIAPPGMQLGPFLKISPSAMFALGWSLAALLWIGIFLTASSQLLGVLFGLLPLVLIKLGDALAIALPPAPAALAASIVAWVAFGLWYMNVRSLRQMPAIEDRSAIQMDGAVARFSLPGFGPPRGAMLPIDAINQYLLGSPSPKRSALVLGFTWVLMAGGVLLLMSLALLGKPAPTRVMALISCLPLFMISSASFGFALTRRARRLWLRAGQDRALLFVHAERGGITFSLLSLGVVAAAFLAFSLLSWPGRSAGILVFAAAQFTFALCLFYCGMSLTCGWAPRDVLLCLALIGLFMSEVLVLRPWGDAQGGAVVMLGLLLLLAAMLRWHARRRWRELDWRIARPVTAYMPT